MTYLTRTSTDTKLKGVPIWTAKSKMNWGWFSSKTLLRLKIWLVTRKSGIQWGSFKRKRLQVIFNDLKFRNRWTGAESDKANYRLGWKEIAPQLSLQQDIVKNHSGNRGCPLGLKTLEQLGNQPGRLVQEDYSGSSYEIGDKINI
ncbi:hypothetical protein FQA39_LY18703 [Lamprigera yunnana]|nr:hypothetical protein FQA39_LY18703 [Lamprigera yunnana]